MTWRTDAACRGADADLFFPDRGDNEAAAAAVAICAGCTVRAECLEEALSRPEPLGIWGGKTTVERRYLRRERKRELPEHGTAARYGRGCRCEACRGAEAERKRPYQARRPLSGYASSGRSRT